LLQEIDGIASADLAEAWAREALATKKHLVVADATRVEEAFEQKVAALAPSEVSGATRPEALGGPSTGSLDQSTLDESALAISKPRRYRNKEHLRYVARQACLICGRQPSDPHHLRYAQPRALGRKASDEFTVPLCRVHHREVHRLGNEEAWWQAANIDPLDVAQKLWNRTRVSEGRIEPNGDHPQPSGTAADPAERSSKIAPEAPAKRAIMDPSLLPTCAKLFHTTYRHRFC
jgi:hypothetical protein